MIDDFRPVAGRKPKVIEPLPKTNKIFLDTPTSIEPEPLAASVVGEDPTISVPVETIAIDEPIVDEPPTQEGPDPELASITENGSFKPRKQWGKPRLSWPPTKKQLVIGGAVLVLLIAGSTAAYTMTHRSVKVVANTIHRPKPKPVAPKTVPSTLTGLQVDASVNQRPVTGTMIENSIDARPQSGLDQAGVVFEAIAEGGVTRFMALFQDTQPDYLGPIRSARPYYVQWCLGFDCSYAHVGGSPDGLAEIKALGVKDLDQFANSGAYQRISNRYAPHNVYTSIAALNQVESSKGFGASTYTGFSRKADTPYKAPAPAVAGKPAPTNQDTRQAVNSIDFALSGAYYNPHFDYDAATNSYKRSEAGVAHMEVHKDGSQVQITPKVVIGMIVTKNQGALDSSGAYYSNYAAIGSGQALVFQDGTVTSANWSKADGKSQISFTDANGKALKLNAGQTWITAISATGQATYK